MNNILLISPAADNESLWLTGNEDSGVLNNMPPLGLATVAASTPREFTVDIWDENVHGLIDDCTRFEKEYGLVGITGYKSHLPRCRELSGVFRKRSIPVAIGGPGVSGTPDEYRDDFDILFIGEAEKTWPCFLQDWKTGAYRHEYRQIEKIDLACSPLPRWDSIAGDMGKYAMGCVQTTRGCPFDCEFCDVIYLFGRRQRHKPVQNVIEEVKALQGLGLKSIFFNDDEFIGNRQYAKEVLRALITLNDLSPSPLAFSTQLTMNVSKDSELLELLADANFNLLFIGIETPNKESLRLTKKLHNIQHDIVEEVRKILSYGLGIRAGMIVGFDHDDSNIFKTQYRFMQDAYLPSIAINMLKAPFGTRLWARLRQEGRVVSISPAIRGKLGHSRSYTNIIPKLMTRTELLRGYRDLIEKIYGWQSFLARMRGLVSVVSRPPRGLLRDKEAGRMHLDIAALGVGPNEAGAIGDLLAYTMDKAPYMMGRVESFILQHAKYCETINRLLPQLDRQIELESSGALVFEPDSRPIAVSAAFKEAYKNIFPDVYRRVYLNIKDRTQVNAALVEVFVDFLVRWGDGFSGLEPHHEIYFNEICDRTCAGFNSQPPEEFVAVVSGDEPVPDVKHLRLDDDILKSVEHEIIKLSKTGTGS